MDSPWDKDFMHCMNEVALTLCKEISGAFVGYVQSDECTVIAYPYKKLNSEPWFGNVVQKLASISASISTLAFNTEMSKLREDKARATFDSRVFCVPQEEVNNVLLDRQRDCERNSILSLAQNVLGKKSIHGMDTKAIKEKLIEVGNPWEEQEHQHKYGRMTELHVTEVEIPKEHRKKDGPCTVFRPKWKIQSAILFSEENIGF
jgi:tRNA(His) 5'-end guanylyltransferase